MARRGPAAYGRSAEYYDFIYEDIVDYAGDVRYLEAVFRRWMEARPRSILDLGCGTGSHDLPLARRGHEVWGLDVSRAQLEVARRKARGTGAIVRFVEGDMRTFDLGRSFDAAVCMFGAIGYLLPARDFMACLRRVRRHLRPGGVFVFEFWQSSGAKPGPYLGWTHKVGPRYELVRTSESRFDPRTQRLPIEFRFFVFRGKRVVDRFEETHTIRTYTVPQMRALLSRGGFRLLATYAATPLAKGFAPPRRDTFRIIAVARPSNLK